MRLTRKQIQCLTEATHSCFGENAEIWLFGSRVDDAKKGGDIDLYIETDLKKGIVQAKLAMRSQIWDLFGEQKIDITVRKRNEEPNAFHKIAKATGVRLLPDK